ncbi:MAG: sodium:proton antiporter, partial [Chitinophagaceae bacterium]|nr:sodium:proton antiporter [Chitinophagaceae bacterium]
VLQFAPIVGEAAFLVRSLFFILFGFLMETSEILNPETLVWALGIVAGIYVVRVVLLRLAKVDLFQLVFLAPRGLITILLFLSIKPEQQIGLVNKSLIIQVILLSAIVMMVGMLLDRRKAKVQGHKEEEMVVEQLPQSEA